MKPDNPMPSKLRDEAVELIKNRRHDITYAQIADAANVSVRWVEDFAKGRVKNPGVCYVEAVIEYLTKAQLLV